MNQTEAKRRLAAWSWAATTMGVEASPERLRGLVEVTKSVRVESLKPALEAVIKAEPSGFLPSPGAVIEASKRLAERSAMNRPRLPRGEMSPEEAHRWWSEINPQGWDVDTWRAFGERMATDPLYAKHVKRAMERRHQWVADEIVREIGSRTVTYAFRIRLRRELNAEALDHFPRPHPTQDGWVPSGSFDPVAGVGRSVNE